MHEFACLCALLTDRDEIRRALMAYGTDLTRVQQDVRQDRNEFWDRLVAQLIKDEA